MRDHDETYRFFKEFRGSVCVHVSLRSSINVLLGYICQIGESRIIFKLNKIFKSTLSHLLHNLRNVCNKSFP